MSKSKPFFVLVFVLTVIIAYYIALIFCKQQGLF